MSCKGRIDTTVILSRPSIPLRSAHASLRASFDDEGSQVAASVDLEILPLRYAQGQDDVLHRYHFDRFTTLAVGILHSDLHVHFGLFERVEANLLIQSVRIARQQMPASKLLQIGMVADGLHQLFGNAATAM